MKKKIVLIGMMGSGKTTIGRILSKKLGLNFVDTDILIEKECGLGIKEIFEKYGEKYHTNEEFLDFDAKQFCSFDPTNSDSSELTKEELIGKWLEWRKQRSQRRFIVCTNNELPNKEDKSDTAFNKWRKNL